MHCYQGLGALRNMRQDAFYADAFDGELSLKIQLYISQINYLDREHLLCDDYKSLLNEIGAKIFYVNNYILELRKYICRLKSHPNFTFEFNAGESLLSRKNNIIYKFSRSSEISRLFDMDYTVDQVILILCDDLMKLEKAQKKLTETYLNFMKDLRAMVIKFDNYSDLEVEVLRSHLGFYKVFPRLKSEYPKSLLMDFFCDVNLYFNFSNKLECVPAVISPVVTPNILTKFKTIINQSASYQDTIEDLSKIINTSPKQFLIIDRSVRKELVPLPKNNSLEYHELSAEIHYLYFVGRPEFDNYLAKIGAFIDGVRPVWSHKRQEQYFHVFNTLHKDDFNGFDEYLEILTTIDGQETKIHYDEYYKRANSALLNIIETITSNFEFIYIVNTNSLWHCTQKLKAKNHLLTINS